VPPRGLLVWLTTRPVIESKRLPELAESQVRYVTEQRTCVRLAPRSEKDPTVVSGIPAKAAIASAGRPPPPYQRE
jgi:hypothetical protein